MRKSYKHSRPYGTDLESIRHEIENGVDTASKFLPTTLELDQSAPLGAEVPIQIFVVYDSLFCINLDGTISVSTRSRQTAPRSAFKSTGNDNAAIIVNATHKHHLRQGRGGSRRYRIDREILTHRISNGIDDCDTMIFFLRYSPSLRPARSSTYSIIILSRKVYESRCLDQQKVGAACSCRWPPAAPRNICQPYLARISFPKI